MSRFMTIKAEEIAEAFETERRQYFVGNLKRPQHIPFVKSETAEDLNDFRKYAKPNILFAAIRDTKEDDGVVALVTNTDFVSPVNLFMQRRGYPAPTQTQEDDTVKKDAPRTQQGNSSPERGNGSTVSRMSQTTRTTDTAEKISDIPTVKGRLAVLQKTAAGMRDGQAKQRSQPTQQKSR